MLKDNINKTNKAFIEEYFNKVKTGGRPKLVLNEFGKETIIKLSEIMCNDEEIAALLGVTIETLQNSDNNASFLECKQKGQSDGKKSLRRIQFEIARKGNAAMAIWLGKQWLGQTEERQSVGDKELPVFNFHFSDGTLKSENEHKDT